MTKFLPALFALALSFAPLPAISATGEEDRAIQHLIDFVDTSNVRFVRDGISYNSREAADHLAMKYRYVRARVNTADEFIEHIATKSSLSNIPYRVETTSGRDMMADDWLRAELSRYRSREGLFTR